MSGFRHSANLESILEFRIKYWFYFIKGDLDFTNYILNVFPCIIMLFQKHFSFLFLFDIGFMSFWQRLADVGFWHRANLESILDFRIKYWFYFIQGDLDFINYVWNAFPCIIMLFKNIFHFWLYFDIGFMSFRHRLADVGVLT